jgi:hypothetical protein
MNLQQIGPTEVSEPTPLGPGYCLLWRNLG